MAVQQIVKQYNYFAMRANASIRGQNWTEEEKMMYDQLVKSAVLGSIEPTEAAKLFVGCFPAHREKWIRTRLRREVQKRKQSVSS